MIQRGRDTGPQRMITPSGRESHNHSRLAQRAEASDGVGQWINHLIRAMNTVHVQL